MEVLKIWFLCIFAAVLYGIVHDQVTVRVCLEYFTVYHPDVFHTTSPTLLAFGWGVIATWWMGAIIGYLLVLTARVGRYPKLNARQLIRPLGLLLLLMAVSALSAGIAGWAFACGRGVSSQEARFLADLFAHNASYYVGGIGGVVLCGWAVTTRRKMAESLG